MAWSARTSTTAAKAGGAPSLKITKPTGTADGDLMVLALTLSAANTPTMPAGWTLLETVAANGVYLKVYYKVAASEAADYTISGLPFASTGGAGLISLYGETLTATPFDKDGVQSNSFAASPATVSTPSLASVSAGNAVITVFASSSLLSSVSQSPPSGETELVDVIFAARHLAINYETQAASGATGAKSATLTAVGGVSTTYDYGYIASFNAVAAAAVSRSQGYIF